VHEQTLREYLHFGTYNKPAKELSEGAQKADV
jgi:hypothetical protein